MNGLTLPLAPSHTVVFILSSLLLVTAMLARFITHSATIVLGKTVHLYVSVNRLLTSKGCSIERVKRVRSVSD
jgi:hypothetical protein